MNWLVVLCGSVVFVALLVIAVVASGNYVRRKVREREAERKREQERENAEYIRILRADFEFEREYSAKAEILRPQ